MPGSGGTMEWYTVGLVRGGQVVYVAAGLQTRPLKSGLKTRLHVLITHDRVRRLKSATYQLRHKRVGGVHQVRGTPKARHGRRFHPFRALDLLALLEDLVRRG